MVLISKKVNSKLLGLVLTSTGKNTKKKLNNLYEVLGISKQSFYQNVKDAENISLKSKSN